MCSSSSFTFKMANSSRVTVGVSNRKLSTMIIITFICNNSSVMSIFHGKLSWRSCDFNVYSFCSAGITTILCLSIVNKFPDFECQNCSIYKRLCIKQLFISANGFFFLWKIKGFSFCGGGEDWVTWKVI